MRNIEAIKEDFRNIPVELWKSSISKSRSWLICSLLMKRWSMPVPGITMSITLAKISLLPARVCSCWPASGSYSPSVISARYLPSAPSPISAAWKTMTAIPSRSAATAANFALMMSARQLHSVKIYPLLWAATKKAAHLISWKELRELAAMKREGLLTDEEFSLARKSYWVDFMYTKSRPALAHRAARLWSIYLYTYIISQPLNFLKDVIFLCSEQ